MWAIEKAFQAVALTTDDLFSHADFRPSCELKLRWGPYSRHPMNFCWQSERLLCLVTGCSYRQEQSQPEKHDAAKDGDEGKEDLFTDGFNIQRENACIKIKC